MPLLDPVTPPHGLAIASSAIIIALLEAIVAKGILDKSEVQNLLRSAMTLVSSRGRSREGTNALNALDRLWDRFCEP
jgi:hypothetical protein